MENDVDKEFLEQFRKTRSIFQEMGIDPEQLEERIADLEAQISQIFFRLQKLDGGKISVTEMSVVAALKKQWGKEGGKPKGDFWKKL